MGSPSGMEDARLKGHSDRVWNVSWSGHSGTVLASCGGDKSVRIWNEGSDGSWECVEKLEGAHQRTVRRCKFSQCETMIATVSFDATTCVWERKGEGWELASTLEGHESEVKDVAWSPDGELLATCGRDKSIWIWLKEIDDQFECLDVLQGHTQDVKTIAWIPSSRAMVSAGYDNTLKVWNEVSEEWVCTQTLDSAYQGHEDTVWGLAFSPQGGKLVSCDGQGMILLWEIKSQEEKYELTLISRNQIASGKAIYSIDWSRSGVIACGSGDNSIILLDCIKDPEDGTEILKMRKEIKQAHAADVNCVSFHPRHPDLLASGGDDELVKVWNVR